jgi:hypothetical protein
VAIAASGEVSEKRVITAIRKVMHRSAPTSRSAKASASGSRVSIATMADASMNVSRCR